MAQISRFLRSAGGGYAHYCPACHELHFFSVETPLPNGSRWNFDGDVTRPTFQPSMSLEARDPHEKVTYKCHYVLRQGILSYLSDSTHRLSGSQISLPPLPMDYCDPHG